MNWFNGDGTPDLSAPGAEAHGGTRVTAEDPLKSAAKEMEATIAAHAMNKAQLVGSGMAGLIGGGVPSPEAIANWQNTGVMPKTDPYAHLTRDEKLALISQLQKSKAAKRQPPAEPAPDDMVDALEYLNKGGGVPGQVEKGGGVPGKLEKTCSEDDEKKKKEETPAMSKALRNATTDDLAAFALLHAQPIQEPSATELLETFAKSTDGEGSRGGHVIGHTSSGKAIYKPTDDHVSYMKQHVNLQKKTATSKLDEHGAAHVSKHSKDYSAADHKEAAEAHGKEAKNFKNSDKIRAFHEAISHAHGALAEGKKTPHDASEDKKNKAYEAKKKREAKKETERKKDTVATAPGGHKIQNTHHIRNSSGFGPEIQSGPAKGQGGKFGLKHPPIETEDGPHLTAEQHRDIAAYHKEQAHHHAAQTKNKAKDVVERMDHRKTMEQHEFGAKHHEEQAKKKESAGKKESDENQGSFKFEKSSFSGLDDFIQKSESGQENPMTENAIDIFNDFLSKSEAHGGMPCGEVPSEMPTGRREVDGGSLEGVGMPSGAQSPPEATVASTSGASAPPSQSLQGSTPGEKDLEDEAGGEKLSKGNFVDWNDAADDGEFQRAQLVSQFLNKSLDVSIGIGVKRHREAPVVEQRTPQVYLQKGGHTVYVDSEDERIEKSIERAGGLTFTQGAQANIGAPIQHNTSCPNCNALVKSYLSSCTDCGVSLQGHQYEQQGLHMEKSVAEALLFRGEDDVSIGI